MALSAPILHGMNDDEIRRPAPILDIEDMTPASIQAHNQRVLQEKERERVQKGKYPITSETREKEQEIAGAYRAFDLLELEEHQIPEGRDKRALADQILANDLKINDLRAALQEIRKQSAKMSDQELQQSIAIMKQELKDATEQKTPLDLAFIQADHKFKAAKKRMAEERAAQEKAARTEKHAQLIEQLSDVKKTLKMTLEVIDQNPNTSSSSSNPTQIQLSREQEEMIKGLQEQLVDIKKQLNAFRN